MFQCDNCETWFSPLSPHIKAGSGKDSQFFCSACMLDLAQRDIATCEGCKSPIFPDCMDDCFVISEVK